MADLNTLRGKIDFLRSQCNTEKDAALLGVLETLIAETLGPGGSTPDKSAADAPADESGTPADPSAE